jgi:hypothetical protein
MSKVTDVVMEYHMKPEPLMKTLTRAGFSDIRLDRQAGMIRAS